jgi:cellulose synthase/poly-beta-1,6-N-acetylglucosamine synthase-like glycosyltransferase
MAEKKPQTFANHSRLDPLFHFVAAPIFLLAALGGLIHLIWRPSYHSASFFVIAVAAVIALTKSRLYALKVQDRVIRLEERLRLSALCSEAFRPHILELTEDQLIGLRFASDAEVCSLAERALKEKLSRADIKKAIQNWRPDYWRV